MSDHMASIFHPRDQETDSSAGHPGGQQAGGHRGTGALPCTGSMETSIPVLTLPLTCYFILEKLLLCVLMRWHPIISKAPAPSTFCTPKPGSTVSYADTCEESQRVEWTNCWLQNGPVSCCGRESERLPLPWFPSLISFFRDGGKELLRIKGTERRQDGIKKNKLIWISTFLLTYLEYDYF